MQIALLNDQQLIAQYLEGNESAFNELLNRHKSKVYTSIYLFVKDKDLAEDIFQEVFIKVIDTLRKGKYNHEGKFNQWVMRIAYNMCVDYFRRDKRRPLQQSDENAEQSIIRNQTHNAIRQLVDKLPAEQREVVILRHYADMSFKEIAQLTRVSINTSLGRMRYALINISRMMMEKELVYQ